MHRTMIRPAVAVIAVLGAVVTGCGDDEEAAETTTTTTEATTTTTEATTTSTPAAEVGLAVWPPADGSVSYDDPVEAARGFATEMAGFADPVLGEFRQGDSRSGEVEVRPRADGPVTTVMVRQLQGEDWSVIAAATDDLQPDRPERDSTISSPVTIGGTSTAFEATIQVAVKALRSGEPLGQTFAMGGSMGEMGPFETSVEFAEPDTDTGVILVWTESMEDGSVWSAAAVPVRFEQN